MFLSRETPICRCTLSWLKTPIQPQLMVRITTSKSVKALGLRQINESKMAEALWPFIKIET